MKKLMVVMLLTATLTNAAPDAYPLAVHVSAVHWRMTMDVFGKGISTLFFDATVDGKKYELSGPALYQTNVEYATLVNPGDYKAKMVRDDHKTTYESATVYEIRFADGKTAKFSVVGMFE
jgi:hypothetical protein